MPKPISFLLLVPLLVLLITTPLSSIRTRIASLLLASPLQPTPTLKLSAQLFKRQQTDSTSTRTSSSPTTSQSNARVPPAPTLPPTAAGAIPTPFPAAFDLSLSLNFTSTECQDFFFNFTQSEQFRRCRPFSLLFSSSSQFSQALSNATLLTAIVWGTCNTLTPKEECLGVMDRLLTTVERVCASELKNGNVLASQAHTGFKMYSQMREAACLVNNRTQSYCFVEAAADESPIDLYFWELPNGHSIPSGSIPSCSDCIRDVMSIYAKVVTDAPKRDNATALPLASTYPPASQIAAKQCGSAYVQEMSTSAAIFVHPGLAVLMPNLIFWLGVLGL